VGRFKLALKRSNPSGSVVCNDDHTRQPYLRKIIEHGATIMNPSHRVKDDVAAQILVSRRFSPSGERDRLGRCGRRLADHIFPVLYDFHRSIQVQSEN
jgi:hypothetical protein